MKRKNGFTLIELLAAIIILGIIALIAVPTIKDVMDESNKKAFMNTAYGIVEAGELYHAKKDMLAEELVEEVFEFPNGAGKLKTKGKLPKEGKMIINADGDIAMAISDGKYCITKSFENEDVTITDDDGTCELPYVYTMEFASLATIGTFTSVDGTVTSEVTEVDKCAKSGTCIPGTPFAIKVNNDEIYKFYVIEDTGKAVTLIMDRNLGNKVAWYKDNDDTTNRELNNLGPITALNYLNSQTNDWNNIPAINNYEYSNTAGYGGYQKLEIVDGIGKLTSKDGATITEITGVSRARLLTYEEATTPSACTANVSRCPSWIYDNLISSNIDATPGYWLLTSATTEKTHEACIVYYSGLLRSRHVYLSVRDGVRPVITLSK